MSKSKSPRKLTTAQIVFYILSVLLVLAMVLSAFVNI